MKHIKTLENFLNEGYSSSMLDQRGLFDPNVIGYTFEEAATWAFALNLKLKDKEIDKVWNSQLDDPKSELNKEVRGGVFGKGVNDIERTLRDEGNSPQAIRDALEQLGDRLMALRGVFFGAENSPAFEKLVKAGLAYADKLEKDTPMEPVKITILPGEVFKSKGIRAKEYFEAGYVQCQYAVIAIMKDGRVMKGYGMYASEAEIGSNYYRPKGNELAKQKIFISKYDKAINRISSNPEVTTGSSGSIDLTVIDTSDLRKADSVIRDKVIPSLEKEFPEAEIIF